MHKKKPEKRAKPHSAADGAASEAEAQVAIRMMATAITSEGEFMRVIGDARPELREAVYEMIKPHVGYAGVRPFAAMSFPQDA
jgi:hypothetical protein